MEIKGRAYEVGQTQQVTDSLKKRELILEYIDNPQYPEYIKFEAIQDKTALFDGIKAGDDIEIFFNLKGRKWTDKMGKPVFFNTLQAWKVNKLGSGSSTPEYAPPVDISSAPDDDSLPF